MASHGEIPAIDRSELKPRVPILRSRRSAMDILAQHQTTGALQPELSLKSASAIHSSDPVPGSSSASSVVNIDGDQHDAIVMVQPEVELDFGDGNDGLIAAEGNAQHALRDSLKRTLEKQHDITQKTRSTSISSHNAIERVDIPHSPRQYFVLTNAGKPVFSSNTSVGMSQDDVTSAMGITQALISVYADDGDKLRSITAGNTRIVFLLRAPLYYVCVSSWGEPESVARAHLDYIHLQILSVTTGSQLSRLFERRSNFDLRRLLDGTERFIHRLVRRLELDMGMVMASLNVLRIDPDIRLKIAEHLIPPKDMKDTLYVLLVISNKVVTLVRPRKHSVHPADLHLLLNLLDSLSDSATPDSSSWLPICLPKFNPNGFLHTLIDYVETHVGQENPTEDKKANPDTSTSDEAKDSARSGDRTIGLSVVTADRDGFEQIKEWTLHLVRTLRENDLLTPIFNAAFHADLLASTLGIPGLLHFIYKSRTYVQLVSPDWETPYSSLDEKRRLITMYQLVHDAVHARSGQPGGPLKLHFVLGEKEGILGWVTTPFEVYLALSPNIPKSAAVSAANALTKWIKNHEAQLFLRDAPVF